MSAYNGRFIAKRLFGVPVRAAVAVTASLFSLALALIVPYWILSLVFGVLCVLSLVAAVFYVIDGDEHVFRPIKYQSGVDARAKMIGDVGE